jgi:hypothetical protein
MTPSSGSHRRRLVPALALLALLGGCTTTQAPRGTSEFAALAPQLSVERFLQYVNARDLDSMAGLFGTADGPARGDRQSLELEMDLISRILEHEDYRIVGESSVPGRDHPTRRVGVDLTIGGEVIPNVAFDVVQTREGTWMVTQIDLEAVTNR